ncbi:1-acyl-sn-glycerol-3-phosphate acyltransferase, partial [Glaciimonas sp. CA11.2]|nr:1-acyl-sn-glycerol-3-phosphate acyltransferase [Glaciimonas sp. CA11.2]
MQFFLFLRSVLFFAIMTIATVIWAIACLFFAPFPYARRYYLTSRW